MTEFDFLIDLHLNAERQGPGSPQDTQRALSFLPWDAHTPLQIADIGCGTGAVSRMLAQHFPASTVTAIDLFPDFLERVTVGYPATNLQTLAADMSDLPLAPASLDLIWSEGAIYNMGFEAGLAAWRPLLKDGGYIALSEITWLTAERPQPLTDHWATAYPEIDTAAAKMAALERQGFSPVGYFYLPASSWLQHYYEPMEAQFEAFLTRHDHHPIAAAIVADERHEIALYRQYQAYFSYGFYIARK